LELKKTNQTNGTSSLRGRKTSKKKMIILRELLERKVPIGVLSEKYGIYLTELVNKNETKNYFN
jgi:hypothetical protein